MIYFTIFAGRQRFLSILVKYLEECLSRGIIDEVHFWNFVRAPSDEVYLRQLVGANDKFRLMPVINKRRWDEYYAYYAETLKVGADDIVIKCDDDVVYIDISTFPAFLERVRDGSGGGDGLHFPSIVNNDVCAYIQETLGVHQWFSEAKYRVPNPMALGLPEPLTLWSTNPVAARNIHADFLGEGGVAKYTLEGKPMISYGSRISINFFACTGSVFCAFYEVYAAVGTGDDERIYSAIAPGRLRRPNLVNPNFTVVHFQFGPPNGVALEQAFLGQYAELAKEASHFPVLVSKSVKLVSMADVRSRITLGRANGGVIRAKRQRSVQTDPVAVVVGASSSSEQPKREKKKRVKVEEKVEVVGAG